MQPQGTGHVQSKCGCLHSTFLCVICNSDLSFSLVTMDTAQLCLVTVLLKTVAVENCNVRYRSSIHCKTILSVATLCGIFTVKLHYSGLSLLSLKWWLHKVWQWTLSQSAPPLAIYNNHYAVTCTGVFLWDILVWRRWATCEDNRCQSAQNFWSTLCGFNVTCFNWYTRGQHRADEIP